MKKIHGLELTKEFKQDVDWHCSHEPQFLFPALDSSKVRSLHGSPASIALFFSSVDATWRLPEWLLCRMVGVQGQGVDFQSFLLNVQTSGELQGVYFQSLAFESFLLIVQMCDAFMAQEWEERGRFGIVGVYKGGRKNPKHDVEH